MEFLQSASGKTHDHAEHVGGFLKGPRTPHNTVITSGTKKGLCSTVRALIAAGQAVAAKAVQSRHRRTSFCTKENVSVTSDE